MDARATDVSAVQRIVSDDEETGVDKRTRTARADCRYRLCSAGDRC